VLLHSWVWAVASAFAIDPARFAARGSAADNHVVVAMSGGVDSSVAALLLVRAGFHVSAVFMKNWNEADENGRCQFEADVDDAMSVCEHLDISINTVDLSQAYWDRVFEDFIAEYQRGRTPNPDVLCNREVKFKAFVRHAEALGGDVIATGHYARNRYVDGAYELHKGSDPGKDQSYFLYAIGQAALARTLFPLGDLHKCEVRRIAAKAGLVTHAKKDSTGICFIGERPFRSFLRRYVQAQPGTIRSTTGAVLGQHSGVAFYTLGQREGLGIGGVRGATDGPWFVVAKDIENNELIAAQGHDHPLLMSTYLVADTLFWIAGAAPLAPFKCCAKTRYRQPDQDCVITVVNEDSLKVRFARPQRALTPGQSVVFYDGDRCIGGGIIDRSA